MRVSLTRRVSPASLQRLRRVASVVLQLVCCIGCGIQLAILAEEFFRFDVDTRLEISFPSSVAAPALCVCFPFPDLLDLSAFAAKYGLRFTRPLTRDQRVNITQAIELADVFDMTVRLSSMMHSCVVRLPHDYSPHLLNGSDCRSVFREKRFRIGSYLCDSLSLDLDVLRRLLAADEESANSQHSNEYRTQDLAYALGFASAFYQIRLAVTSPGIRDTDYTLIVLHSSRSLPFISLPLAPVTRRLFSRYHIFVNRRASDVREVNRFLASYSSVRIRKLPYPYASKCRKDFNQFICLSSCTQARAEQLLRRSPFQVVIEESYVFRSNASRALARMRLISQADVADPGFGSLINRLETDCHSNCRDPSCDSDYTMTRVSAAMGMDQSVATFTVATPDEPSVSVISSEKLPANDFLLLSASVVALWLGLSARDVSHALVHLITCCCDRIGCLRKQLARKGSERQAGYPTEERKGRRLATHTRYCVRTRRLLTQVMERETEAAFRLLMKEHRSLNKQPREGILLY